MNSNQRSRQADDVLQFEFNEARITAAEVVVGAINSKCFGAAQLRPTEEVAVNVFGVPLRTLRCEGRERSFEPPIWTPEIEAAGEIVETYIGRGFPSYLTPDYETAGIEQASYDLACVDMEDGMQPTEEEMAKCRAVYKAALATLLEHNAFHDWATIRLLMTGSLTAREVREYLGLD